MSKKGFQRNKGIFTVPPYRAMGTIVLVSVILYFNSLNNAFHYDDIHSIVENPHIRDLSNIPSFFVDSELFSGEPHNRMYRPVLLVSYGLNYAVGGYEVHGYHLVNLLLHILNALLVYGLARSFRRDGSFALFAGLLFAAHPVNTETVNYISSRSSSLAAFFYLSAFYLFI